MTTKLWEKYDMLPRGSHVLAAVSGGKDSVYLLEKLLEAAAPLELKISCGHFDHRLRGGESDRDREFVRNLCMEKGLPCYIGSGDVADFAHKQGLGIEEAARTMRYEFLESTAREIGADRIATAHTADDNAETLLLNLMRGSGLRGLRGIPPRRGKIIRPLLETTSREILEYLRDSGVEFVQDSSNDGDDYARNRVRHRLIPRLRELEPAFDTAVIRCISLLREDEEYLSSLAEEFYEKNLGKDGGLPAEELLKLPEPVASRVLRIGAGRELSLNHTRALMELAASEDPHGRLNLPGLEVRREYSRLIFGKAPEGELKPRQITPGCRFKCPEGGFTVSCEPAKKGFEINNSVNTFYIKSDSICGNIFLTAPAGGEEIRLLGRGCTKKVKKLLGEKKIPLAERKLWPAIRDDKGLIALGGFGPAEDRAAGEGDEALIIRLEY